MSGTEPQRPSEDVIRCRVREVVRDGWRGQWNCVGTFHRALACSVLSCGMSECRCDDVDEWEVELGGAMSRRSNVQCSKIILKTTEFFNSFFALHRQPPARTGSASPTVMNV